MLPKRILQVVTYDSADNKDTIKVSGLKPEAGMTDTAVIQSYIDVAQKISSLSTNTYSHCNVVDTYETLYV